MTKFEKQTTEAGLWTIKKDYDEGNIFLDEKDAIVTASEFEKALKVVLYGFMDLKNKEI